jgi:membrane protein
LFWEKYHPVRFAGDVARVFMSRRCSRSAAELAYFLVLSLFPALVVISAFVGMLHLNIDVVLDLAAEFVPASALALLEDYLLYVTVNESQGLFLAGLIGTITSASAAFRALMAASAEIYGKKTFTPVSHVLFSILFSVLFLVIMYASMVVVLTGSWFLHLLQDWFHISGLPGDWQWMRFLILFCMALAFLACFYRAIAPRGKPRPPVLVGSFLTAVALAGSSILFSWFISMSSRYSLIYGSLASVIILMVWLYLCGNVLLLGNVFNYVWYCHKRAERGA